MQTLLNANKPENGSIHTQTVLIVDDDIMVRTMLQRLLEEDGLQLIEAENGEQALEAFHKYIPDIILMDAAMPVVDGFTACRRIKQTSRGKNTPVLMITALYDDDSVEKAFHAGADDYITKPIHWLALQHRIHKMLKHHVTELAWRRNGRILGNILEHASLGIVVFDLDGHLIRSNPAFKRLLNLPAQTADYDIPQDWCQDENETEKALRGELLTGKRAFYQVEKTLPCPASGTQIPVHFTVSLVYDDNQEADCLLYLADKLKPA